MARQKIKGEKTMKFNRTLLGIGILFVFAACDDN